MKRPGVILLALCLFLLAVGAVSSSNILGFEQPRWTADAGGLSGGGAYALNSAVGQMDAGAPATGGAYWLQGGFLAPVSEEAEAEYQVYLPITRRR